MMRRMSTPADAPSAVAATASASHSPAVPARSGPSGEPRADPETVYIQHRDRALAEVAQRESQARRIGSLRLLAFLLALGAATAAYEGFPASVPAWGLWVLSLFALVAFVRLVLRHDAVLRLRERAAMRAELASRGLRRLDGTWVNDTLPPPLESAPEPARPDPPPPPYARDLDVLGPGSIWHLCDATTTRYGERALSRALSRAAAPSLTLEPARELQAAVRELAPQLTLRHELEVSGRLLADRKGRKPDPEPFARWAAGPAVLSPAYRAALVLPLCTVPALAVQLVHPMNWLGYVVFALLGAQLLVLLLTGVTVNRLVDIVATRERGVSEYAGMLALLAAAPLQAPANQALQAALVTEGHDAVRELRRLHDLVGYLELRRHLLLWFPVNALLLWDLFFALAIGRWQRRAGRAVRRWLEALGELEARSSLAGLHFDNPDWAWPEFTEEPAALRAQALGHPLLVARRRVGNDVELPGPGRGWLLTGSNMSGKSTLLRSIGLLQVLAWAGGPVCARAARLSPMRLRTVMRIDDSVLTGVSHFYAELQRLKETLDEAERARTSGGPPLCYLLDEILHGTNTRERELGARLVVKTLCRRGATGAVSTHDLSLASLEEDTGGAVRNVHFTESVHGGQMTFDYVLRQGPVKTTNALRLMRLVGMQLDWDAEPDAAGDSAAAIRETTALRH